ncbi:MAG: ComEC/Rec2 family competence protein [Solirubrobacteraceae bacterium]
MRPRLVHAAGACAVAGLVLGPRWPPGVLVAALAAPLLAGRRATRAVPAAVVVAAALVGTMRMHAVDRTALRPGFGHAVHARATLLEPARVRMFGTRVAVARLRGEQVLLRAARGVRWPAADVGAVLDVRGGLESLPSTEGAYAARGVHAQLRAWAIGRTGARRGGPLGVVDAVRSRATRALATGLPPPQAALLRGMVLGDDSALPDAVRADMQATGLTHLVAASGANVMLLAALALAIGAGLGIDRRVRLLAVLALIALYVPLAGGGPSIQRAGVTGVAGTVAALAGRPADRRHALLLAAIATLLLQPHAPEQVGWQLSFAAVAGIALLAGRIRDGLGRRRVPVAVAEAVAVTSAATLGTAPLIALHFGQASPVTLPANVLAAPLVAPVMWLGFAAAALGQLSTSVAAAPAAVAGLPASALLALAHSAARWPGAGLTAPPLLVAVACGGASAAIVARRLRGPVLALTTAACLALWGASQPAARGLPPPGGARLTFLDIGQGDATLLQDREHAILVDTGPPGGPILARLCHAGVRRLDALVITHAQDDHDGAAAAVLGALPVALVLDGRDGVRDPSGLAMAARARGRGVPDVAGHRGQRLRAGAVALQVLWPPAPAPGDPPAGGGDPNQRAIVALATLGGMRVLLGADAESDVLAPLDVGPVDVLKVSHHGSADAGLPALLQTLRPRLAGIEVGARNRFGHPVPATLAALRASGARVVRTDRDGNVTVEPEGRRLVVRPHA